VEDITYVDNGIEGFKEIFDKKMADLVILDYHLGRVDGMDILKKAHAYNPDMNIVFLSAQKKVQIAIDSLKYGAIDYLVKDEEAFPKLEEIIKEIAENKKSKGKFRLFKK
jgi:response regulator of citrate/malate metabolism